MHGGALAAMASSADCLSLVVSMLIIIIMLPNQAIASTPSAPRPSGQHAVGCAGCFATMQVVRVVQGSDAEIPLMVERGRHVTRCRNH
jgi:hypothetical protein